MIKQIPIKLKRILVIQTAFLGDLILTLPLIEALSTRFPSADIDVLVEESSIGIFEGQDLAGKLIPFSKRSSKNKLIEMFKTIRIMRSLNCELAIIPHRSFRSSLMAFLAGIPLRVGFSKTAGEIFLTHKISRDPDRHEQYRNLSLLEPISAEISTKPFTLKISKTTSKSIDEKLSNLEHLDGNFISIAPGSVWLTKRWSADHWIQLLKLLANQNIFTIIIGGADDRILGKKIESEVGDHVISFAGEISIQQSAEVIRRSDLLISGDSAPVHLAGVVQTPVLAIFGPTVPEFGFAPTGKNDRVIGMEMDCRPCAIHGGEKCPLEHHKCMTDLKPERVFVVILDMLDLN